jgi:membrane-bound lytic murein transglycosylase D
MINKLFTLITICVFATACNILPKNLQTAQENPLASLESKNDLSDGSAEQSVIEKDASIGTNSIVDQNEKGPIDLNSFEANTHAPDTIAVSDENIGADVDSHISDSEAPPVVEMKPSVTDVWQRIQRGLSLPLELNSETLAHIKWYQRHPSYLKRVTKRAEPFIYFIIAEIEKRGLPADLALLPIVESAFDPFAYSHGRASGLWQFIPGTGRHYGLRQDWWYDGRRDVVLSTKGALDYLESLHKRFDGDWLLAVAAYNSGGGNVNKSIRKNRQRNKPTDFWNLSLPKETQDYVPKLLALSYLLKHKDTLELNWEPVANAAYFEKVDIGGQLDLAKAAKMADVGVDQIYRLNPAFNRWATAPQGPHSLLVPKDKAEQFKLAIQSLEPSERVTWNRYEIQSGDSLIRIAKKFNTTAQLLRDINHIKGHQIRAGKKILVPKASKKLTAYQFSADNRLKKKQSKRYGKAKTIYVVKSGDNFWDLSRKFKVNHRSLAKWNGMAPKDPLKIGQKLVVWHQQAITFSNASTSNLTKKRKIQYQVRQGDSLAKISQKFKVKVKDVKKWNIQNNKKYIHPGDKLTLYVDVANQTAD